MAVVNKKLDTENIRTVLNTTWMMKNFVDFMGINTAEDWSCKYNHEDDKDLLLQPGPCCQIFIGEELEELQISISD